MARDVDLPFSTEEFATRLAKTRAAMEAKGLESLIISDPSNMAWLTGYDGWSFYVHQCVFLTLSAGPFWFGRPQDGNGARRTTALPDEDILGYPETYIQNPDHHPMECLATILEEKGCGRHRIGVELDNYYFSAAAYLALTAHLPNARFENATALVNWCRAVKSPTELDYMRRAGRIVEAMHLHVFETIEPGMRKCDLVAEIYDKGIRGVDGYGGDYPAIVPLLPTGADASAPHLTWDDKPIPNNSGTFFEIAGCYRRYHAPLSRTVYLGTPPQKFLDADQAIRDGIDAGLEKARPGNTCGDIATAFFDVLNRFGIEKGSRAGYSIGLSYPPDWGERTMSIRPEDQSVLEPGMTFHFMPGIWMDDWGLETTESLVITDSAPDCLASVPRDLVVKD